MIELLIRLILAFLFLPLMLMMFCFMVLVLPFAILFGKVTINDIPIKQWVRENFRENNMFRR